ncbi:hypothetical protein [Duncaniella sp.]|uniref:hypothetical protein n=1 Tax=Duncaniella sp. TaxID=2518496 RepID=UPI0023CF6121|nr:hypothetical protein [Duncaniella sp.]MDE5904884.1 hypothetical protein [Duncaniella sp.]
MRYKFAGLLGLALLAGVVTACNDDDNYSAGPRNDNGFYIPDQNDEYLDLEPGDNSITFQVARPVGGPATTANLLHDADPVFNIPSAVEFAEGESVADVTVTFNMEDLLMKDYYISIAISPDEVCAYGDSQLDLTVGVADHLRWKSLGTGLYRDAFLCELMEDNFDEFDNWADYQYECEIMEHKYYSGVYRLVKPYGSGGSFEINCEDPNGCYIEQQNLGQVISGTNLYVFSYAANYLNNGNSLGAIINAGYCGKLENGMITFPLLNDAGSLLTAFPPYLGSFIPCNSRGEFLVMLPDTYSSTPVPAVPVAAQTE